MLHRVQIILALVALSFAGPVPGYGQDENAQEAYNAYGCYQCHGHNGQGGAAGPQLAPEPLPFETFAEIVRRPPNRMPAYSPAMLSDETLALIYQYVETIERPPAVNEIPLLNNRKLR